MSERKDHIRSQKISDLQLRIDLFKEANTKLSNEVFEKESKLKHKIRENVLMKVGFENIVNSENTPDNIKKFCQNILDNVEKYKT